jgi:protein-disulfide isomerase
MMPKKSKPLNKKSNSNKILFFSISFVFIVAVILLFVLENNPQKKSYEFSYENQPMLGEEDAPVKIVEFGDYRCPSCKTFEQQIFPSLKEEFIDTGKAQFYFINHPILGQESVTAAVIGEAVYGQSEEAFWKYYQTIYENQGPEDTEWATLDSLISMIEEEIPEVDIEQLQEDLNEKNFDADLKQDAEEADMAGVTGTPTLFINGVEVDLEDSFDYQKLRDLINSQ